MGSAGLTLFRAGVLFLSAAFASNEPSPRYLRAISLGIAIVYWAYVAVVVFPTGPTGFPLTWRISPTLADLAFAVRMAVWLTAGLKLSSNFQKAHNPYESGRRAATRRPDFSFNID